MINTNQWMIPLADDLSINEIAIPGTHDTMTKNCHQRYYKTQTLSLAEQLAIGVRFLDIRLTRELLAAHREWISDISGQTIMEILREFLRVNPSEFILMRLQNANEKKDDFPQYKQAICQLIEQNSDILLNPVVKEGSENQEYRWPTVGEARGKVIVLECSPLEFQTSRKSDGSSWAYNWHQNELIYLQDNWDGPSIAEKSRDILEMLRPENELKKQTEKLFLNHISATNGDLGDPLSYAEILNPAMAKMLQGMLAKSKTDAAEASEVLMPGAGVQIFDFITEDLAQKNIQLNIGLEIGQESRHGQ